MPARRIYVSGPMTGQPNLNFPAFHEAAAQLRAAGYEVVNPAEINPDPAKPYGECMRSDIAAVCTCSGVATLPGWERSRGAKVETDVARAIGMPVMTVGEWLLCVVDMGVVEA